MESLNMPLSRGKDLVEWDEEILLPLQQSSNILFNVYASTGLGQRLERGELLGRIRLTVGEILDHTERVQPASFLVQREGAESTVSYWSLGISTERRACNKTEPDATSELSQITDTGHHFLLRHAENQNQKDLEEAVACFERALEMCPHDHPNRSAVLFNLARARLAECETNDQVDLDVPITLFQSALHLRDSTHPDYSATALYLSSALLDRFRRRQDENDSTEARSLLSRTIELFPEICNVQVVFAILKLGEMSMSGLGSSDPQTDTRDFDDENLIRKAQFILANIPDSDPHRVTLLARFAMLLKHRFTSFENVADIHESISMSEMALKITPDGHPEKPAMLNLLGCSLADLFGRVGDIVDIDNAILMHEEAVRLTPNGEPNRPVWLGELGSSLSRRFYYYGHIEDIDKSISTHQEAVHLTSSGHPDKPARLCNLAISFSARFDHLGDITDIDKSILMLEEADGLTPNDHLNKPTELSNLAHSLSRRFDHLGDITDINRSISMYVEAVRLTPNDHPIKPDELSGLATSLCRRFDRLGDVADINSSISRHEEALRLIPSGHPSEPARLCNLAISLSARFGHLGDITDINKSISTLEKAVHLTPNDHPNKQIALSSLAHSLSCRFDRLGDITDINNSISFHEKAVSLVPNEHPGKPIVLNSLAHSLFRRFDHFSDLADIDKSISMHEEAVHLLPNTHPNKPALFGSLANSLSRRFDHLGNIVDIDKSILMHEEAVRLTPNGHPDKPTWLSELGNSFSRRFHYYGDIVDIDKSILTYQEAVYLTPSGHINRLARLGNLANSLSRRFERLGDIADIDKSISMLEEAMLLTASDHPNKPIALSGLAHSLSRRFDYLGDVVDIDKSILMYEEAVRLTPNDHPNKPIGLGSLAHLLARRFDHIGDMVDIEKSISTHEEAVRLTPDGHSSKPHRLTHLGHVYMKYFNHVHDQSKLSTAIFHLSVAAKSSVGPTSQRFHAASKWMACVRLLADNHQSLLDPCSTIIALLPQLPWLGLPLAERHRALLNAAGIASDAAAAAIDNGQLAMAVEWLEQGRSIVWSQLLHLRVPVDDLHVDYPILAAQFQQTSHELEHIGSRLPANIEYLPSVMDLGGLSLEKETQRHHELVIKHNKLLEEIRALPGFERFQLPKTIEQLSTFARSGPVVYLNASRQRCDALIIKAKLHGAILVPFPDVSYHELRFLLRLLLQGTRSSVISSNDILTLISSVGELAPSQRLLSIVLERGSSDGRPGGLANEEYSPDTCLERILKYLWVSVIKPVLNTLGFSTPPSGSELLPRIFWCPTGPFSFLPIHAAGQYGSAYSGRGNKVSDFVISSYIPTISALAPSVGTQSSERTQSNSNSPQSSHTNLRVVAVPQPPNDGQAKLHGVEKELDHIKQLLDSSPFVTLQNSDGTIEDAMEKMKASDWVHFACHGVQDREHPLDSGLCLAEKRRLKLSDIIHLSRHQGGLAFLSACQTATGDEKLPEESVHLAAGMILAGYSGIIATMWSIKDHDAPQVTRDVYEYLFRGGKSPDPLEAAEALHHAVQHLRDSGAPFSSWVPFIHVGR